MQDMARLLILSGVLIAVIGGAMLLLSRLGVNLGHLPGDITIQTDGLSCFFPIVTSIILSIVLTVLLNLVLAILRRP